MLDKQASIFTIAAMLAAVATLLVSLEPEFTRVGGSSIGLGLVAAGFAIAAAIANRSPT